MKKNMIKKGGWWRWISAIAAAAVLLAMSAIFLIDQHRLGDREEEDTPPVIEFTWTPLGEVDLKEFRGFLKMSDDYGLDFSTYRMEIVELNKSYGIGIEGMIGKDYEAPISLSLLANNSAVVGKNRLTIRFAISDDRGQETVTEKIVHIKPISAINEASITAGGVVVE